MLIQFRRCIANIQCQFKTTEALTSGLNTFEKIWGISKATTTVYAQNGGDTEWPYVYKTFKGESDAPIKIRYVRNFVLNDCRVKVQACRAGYQYIKIWELNARSRGLPSYYCVLDQDLKQCVNNRAETLPLL